MRPNKLVERAFLAASKPHKKKVDPSPVFLNYFTAMIFAKTYDDSTNDTLEAPLLEQQISDEEEQKTQEQHASINTSSLLLGLLVGFFIQFSTLGANYLVITVWGEDVLNSSKNEIITISVLWSLFTSSMAIVILAFLRNVIMVSYRGVDMDQWVLHVECRFVVGALVGVCSAWAFTDYMLGLAHQIVYSVATLAVSLLWCRFMLWMFTPAVDNNDVSKQRRTTDVPDILMIV